MGQDAKGPGHRERKNGVKVPVPACCRTSVPSFLCPHGCFPRSEAPALRSVDSRTHFSYVKYEKYFADVAQLVRAPDCGTGENSFHDSITESKRDRMA